MTPQAVEKTQNLLASKYSLFFNFLHDLLARAKVVLMIVAVLIIFIKESTGSWLQPLKTLESNIVLQVLMVVQQFPLEILKILKIWNRLENQITLILQRKTSLQF